MMAIEPIVLEALIEECKDGKARRLLSLGYPDILAEPGQLDDVPERADAADVRAWHKWPHRIPDTEAAFRSMGIDATYIDVTKARGPEVVWDLNNPMLADYEEAFDIILDPGTAEHIFNIANVFCFIVSACRLGSLVIHTNPLNQANHGFWSVNPTAYIDWYAANGFELVGFGILTGPVRDRKLLAAPPHERFDAPENSAMLCAARKVTSRRLRWPIQTKYKINPMLKGAA